MPEPTTSPKLTTRANISFAFRGIKATLPPNLLGWETGTLEVSDVSFKVDDSHKSDFEAEATRLRVVTSEKVEVLSKKKAEVSGGVVKWHMDKLRMPVYSRYQSSVVFGIGKGGGPLSTLGIGADKPDAVAVLWMQDLTDDIEQDVQIPVFVSEDIENLKQNVINDQTAKHHDFTMIGMLSARIKLDSGLDEDHEVSRAVGRERAVLIPEYPVEPVATTRSRGLVSGYIQQTTRAHGK